MGGLGHQKTSPFALPGSPPGAGSIVGVGAVEIGDDPGGPHQFAQRSALNKIMHIAVGLGGPAVIEDAAD